MPIIKLTRGKVVVVDESDYGFLNQWTWLCMSNGYAARFDYFGGKKKIVLMHRLIMRAGAGKLVDHINRDKLDNRKENLRVVSQTINHLNSKVRSSTGFKGVTLLSTGKYLAQLKLRGRNYNLGCFLTPQEAHRAYERAVDVYA